MKNYIYALIDSKYNEVRYIGKTTNCKKRLVQHISECKYVISFKNNWLFYIIREGRKPEMLILDEIDFSENWEFWEQFYISLYKSWGFNLTNATKGGSELPEILKTKEARKKAAATNKGRKNTKEHNINIGKGLKNYIHSDVSKMNMSIAAKKRGISKETQRKMADARLAKGWKHSEESKQKIKDGHRTKKLL